MSHPATALNVTRFYLQCIVGWGEGAGLHVTITLSAEKK